MRKLVVMAAAFVIVGAQAWAACGPVCPTPCAKVACPKPPKMRWTTVNETVMVKVPVQRWVEEEVEVPCLTSKMVTKQVPCTVMEPVVEEVAGTSRKQVWEEEQYDSFEYRTVTVECQGTKKVCRTEPVCETKKVRRRVYEEICDPATGKITRCPRYVYDEVQVESKRKVIEEIPYTYKKQVKEKVPVVKTRKVCKWVEVPCTQKVTRMVPKTVMKDVQVEEKVTVTKKVMKKKCITEYVEQPQVVCKRVQVPVEEKPCPPPAPKCQTGCAPAKPVCDPCKVVASVPAVIIAAPAAPVQKVEVAKEAAAPAV